MAQVSFDCANSHGSLLDLQVADVDDLGEARRNRPPFDPTTKVI